MNRARPAGQPPTAVVRYGRYLSYAAALGVAGAAVCSPAARAREADGSVELVAEVPAERVAGRVEEHAGIFLGLEPARVAGRLGSRGAAFPAAL